MYYCNEFVELSKFLKYITVNTVASLSRSRFQYDFSPIIDVIACSQSFDAIIPFHTPASNATVNAVRYMNTHHPVDKKVNQ